MSDSADSFAELEGLIGVWEDVVSLSPGEIRPRFKRVVDHGDESLLDALYARAEHNVRLIPWTPAWLGGVLMREGELALIYNRLVFFKKRGSRGGYKHLFCVPLAQAKFKLWHVPTLRGFTVTVGAKSYKVSTYPRRGSHLREVSGASESAGLADVVGGALGLVSETANVLGGVGEALASYAARLQNCQRPPEDLEHDL